MMQRLGLRATPKKNNSNENENANAWSSGPAKALPLVYCDERGKFEMDPQAVAALHLVKGPLGVVSLCGRARQGKSFILNQLLGRSNGFQVASTHRPCTKGLWMWSTPLKRIAPDGTEYNLLLLDSEGIDAYDQTGTYSTQIFSLAVLLSSMFVYNQMGAIDEAALDRLSLVTEMTKHIRVRASENRSTAAELGQFSPIFLWLLRDFYFDLTENGQTITPREYLESALQPMAGSGKAIAAKNEIRESIRALFPDRECFTLVRPINDEHDLQRLDQLPLEKMRPEFRVGLDSLTKFIFERTRPKQVGSTTMTGPLLAGLIQSFLDALNSGAVPTIATSWQNVEENECRRACDCALEVYTKSFDKSFPADEEVLQEVHESAVQKCLEVYNSVAVGAGAAQHKYEKQLLNTLKKEFEQHRLKVFMEAELKCVKAIERMDEKLRAACNAPSANMDHVLEVLNSLMIEYEQHTFTQLKWQKLAKFFLRSLDGPLSDLIKKLRDRSAADYSALALKCRSLEDKLVLLGKQLDASQKDVQDWKRRYEAVSANNKLTLEEINAKHTALQSKYNTLDDKFATASHQLEVTRKHSSDWRSKYEQLLLDRRVDEERLASETTSLQSRCSAAEVRLAAAREQLESAKEEASEWRRKHDAALLESRAAVGKATTMQDRASKQAQAREDALRTEFTSKVEAKERELRDALKRLEHEEDQNAKLSALVKEQEARLSSHDEELVVLRSELHHLGSVIDNAKAKAQSAEREVAFMKQERNHEEERLNIELKRLEAAEAKCRLAEEEVKRASEIVEKAREEASLVEREKHEVQRLAVERLTSLERLERLVDGLHRDKEELVKEVEQLTVVGQEASSKITTLEKRLEEREKEIENLLHSEREQRADSVQVLQSLLASERQANAEANSRAEALSLQLQITQAKLDQRQQELTTVRLNETALDTKVKAMNNEQAGASRGKRHRADDFIEEAAMDADNGSVKKGARVSGNSPTGGADSSMRHNENDDDVSSGVKDSEDYLKFTIAKLKQELTKAGFAGELFQLRNPTKKDIVNIYEKHIFKK